MPPLEDIEPNREELSPSDIRAKMQVAAEDIDLTLQRIKGLKPESYKSIDEYDRDVATYNAHIAELRQQREILQESLRTTHHYDE
jgi:hypothetical protein